MNPWLQKFVTTLHRLIMARIRVMPIIFFCAGMMLTVKMVHVVSHLTKPSSEDQVVLAFPEAEAAEAAPAGEAKPELEKDAKPAEGAPKTDKKEGNKSGLSDFDPFNMTPEEYKTLQELADREKEVDASEKTAGEKTAVEQAMSAQLDKKIQELKDAQANLDAALKAVDEKSANSTKRLVKMCEGMKPTQAAAVLEGVEFDVLLEIMSQIKEATASAILAQMEPKKAAYLITELARRKELFKKDEAPAA